MKMITKILVAGMCILGIASICGAKENLITNGHFKKSSDGWSTAYKINVDGKTEKAPVKIYIEKENNTEFLKISFKHLSKKSTPWTVGVVAKMKKNLKPFHKYKITFLAKSLNGSRNINIMRRGGGGCIKSPVVISDELKKYETLFVVGKWNTREIIFSLVSSPMKSEEGEFLIDNVTVSPLEDQ